MQTIFPLPDDVVSQVAAGEVIERPASVIKELIENALDAGATDILVEVVEGGRECLAVIDNGQGIDRQDFPWLTARHATSKLTATPELFQLRTYGFRGEALASLAAVGELLIQSRPAAAKSGYQTRWRQGEVVQQGPVGLVSGTKVEVSGLFSQLPARRKFLKPAATEWRHIVDTVTRQALVTPHVRWVVKHNGEDCLHLPIATHPDERLQQVLGQEKAQQMMPVELAYPHLGVTGWIGRPPLGTSRALHQYVFVNGRSVKNRLIAQVVKNAYQHYLDPRSHPVFCLFLQLPTETVDINIHPRKENVNFLNEGLVAQLVEESITQALQSRFSSQEEVTTRHQALISDAHTQTFAGQLLKEVVLGQKAQTNLAAEPILQLDTLVLAVASPAGLLLIDQHAAHERILYEQFRLAYEQQRAEGDSVKLETPLEWQPGQVELALLNEHLAVLQQLGFDLEVVGQQVQILAVPTLLQDRNIKELLQETLGDLAQLPAPRRVDTPTQLMLAYLACRSAIKGGEYLSPEQRRELVTALAELDTNYTCPHGRPVQVVLDHRALEKLFGR